MLSTVGPRWRGAVSVIAMVVVAAVAAGCAAPQAKTAGAKKRSKEYFAESEYGVKASPRVTDKLSNLPRGGGRDQLGKPYMVRGKMYYPKEDRNYRRVGYASWYGSAFHGRLTANGEIYDMTHLTAAHPTMPLPSYARVTNKANGASIIVRVNDRGPYSNDRIIDLSQQAARMLDYMNHGTAQVEVKYIGRAPLEGRDDSYLMASYRPGKNQAPDPSDGLPTGVMIAMNGPTPTAAERTPSSAIGQAAPAFPGELTDVVPMPRQPVVAAAAGVGQATDVVLPSFGPIAPQRPETIPFGPADPVTLAMGYAPVEPRAGLDPFAALQQPISASASASAKLEDGAVPTRDPFIAAGTFPDRDAALGLAKQLESVGKVSVDEAEVDGAHLYAVSLRPVGGADLDATLRAAWDHGAADAIAVRD